MRAQFKVLFYPRKFLVDLKGQVSLYMRITVDTERAEFSVKRKIDPDAWDSFRGRVRTTEPFAEEINRYLEELQGRAYQIHSYYVVNNKSYTAKTIRDKVQGKEFDRSKMILKLYDEHNAQLEALVPEEHSYGNWRRHVRTREHLAHFIESVYRQQDYPLKKVDLDFINRFEHFLKIQQVGNHNTVMKYAVNFKKITRMAYANNWIKRDPFFHWKAQWRRTEREFLNDYELNLLLEKEFKIQRLSMVRDIFLFSCFTGLAYVDVARLSRDHLVFGLDGQKWIKINRAKTDTRSSIPVLPPALKILAKYTLHPDTIRNGRLLPVISNQKSNAYLKEIATICGIEKNLSFHLARHTFATTVTLSNGIPIESVSKMLGHQSLKTTQIYARVIDRKLKEDMEGLMDKFDIKLA